MLMDHADAQGNSIGRGMDGHRFAIQANLPFIRRLEAIEDFHQRAFARAVLAQQRADFPAAKRKIDGFQHVVRAEGFHDPTHGEVHLFTSVLKILCITGEKGHGTGHGPF